MTWTFLALAMLLQAPRGGEVSWETFTSAAGFSVAMPGTPVEQRERQASPAGPIETVTVMSRDGDTVYVAVRITNPAAVTKAQEAGFFRG